PQDPPINPEFGYMIINAMQFDTGLDGSVKIGNITLQAIGGEGSSSPLSLKNVILQDIAMQDIPIDGVINGTFTIPSTGESATNGGGGSSSGGGGGGTSGEAFENIVCPETDREYVNKESYISYHYELECNIVEYINFTAVTSSGDIAAKVEILKNTSTLVDKAPPGIVFKNLNIWVGNYGWATEKNMQDVVIGFRVDRSWVSQNNIDESSITMYRFNEGQWVPLNTTKKSEDAVHLFLEAQTPGFSPFAITGSSYSKASADDQITGTETGNAGQTSALEATTGSAKWNALISGILVAFFAVLYVIILLLSQKIRTMVLFCRDDLKDPETVVDMNKLIEGPILNDGPFREIPLTEEANILLERKPEGDDRIRFNRLLLESAYPQEIVTKLHERFGPMHWIMLLIIFIPLVGFIDLVGSPLNWVIGILLEWVIVMYLVLKVKKYSSTSRFT
ncbi:MAG: PGF-pre-PGF domain-containing protein, partial [ANME-2 cluster archaeon]|nr:PGF-pre-PGF domain-containing protein [ANME-2 cluster archaeon]